MGHGKNYKGTKIMAISTLKKNLTNLKYNKYRSKVVDNVILPTDKETTLRMKQKTDIPGVRREESGV